MIVSESLGRGRSLTVVLLVLLLASCASTTQLTANYDEYERYRRTRIASTLEQRLGASHEYLKHHRDGVFREEVRAWFTRAEETYFKRAWNSMPRLVAYLRAMPDGPHAEAVADRIVELESAHGFVVKREERELARARGAVARVATAADDRRRFLRELAGWVGTFAGFRSFGALTSELDHEFIYRFRLSEPKGRCTFERCIKSLSYRYEIPDAQELSLREALFDVVLKLDRGALVAASIAGPDLFSRLGEARELRPVRPGDEQARAEAIARAVQILEGAIEPHLPTARCEREAVAPVVLARVCSGLSLTMVAATSPGEDDRIDIAPVP